MGIAVLIIALNILLRGGLLRNQGLFEPDGFFYYSVIRQAIQNHLIFAAKTSMLSGFPVHNLIGEAPGLMAITTIPYYLLGFTGISYYTIMRWMPIVFGVLEAIVLYFIVKHLSKSRALGLLSMAFLSLSSGNIARTAGTVYRGDSFISLFLMVAILFMLRTYESKDRKWLIINGLLASISLSLGMVVWNGSPFIIAVYLLTLILVLLYAFVKNNKKLILANLVLSLGLILVYLLQAVYVYFGMANFNLPFGPGVKGPLDVMLFYLPLIFGSIIALYAEKIRFLKDSPSRKATFAIVAIIVLAVVLLAFFSPELHRVATGSESLPPIQTNSTRAAAITQTTQELQPPSYTFLYSSFNIQLGLGDLFGWLSYVVGAGNNLTILVTLLFSWLGLVLYLFMGHREGIGEHHLKVNNTTINLSPPIIAVFAYAFITTYLQYGAIRYNALISIPLAISAALTFYLISSILYKREYKPGIAQYAAAIIGIALSAYLLYQFYNYARISFPFDAIVAVLMVIMLALLIAYIIVALFRRHLKLKYLVICLIIAILAFNLYSTYYESYTAAQADGINPSFLQAASWLKANTPANSTVLALWPDGSVVEGWGNRTSYMDSVGGERGPRIYNFSTFLFNTSPQSSYLYGIGRPDYLVARNFWYEELGGIAQEGLVSNASTYGYETLDRINSTHNSTAAFFSMASSTTPYKVELVIQTNSNGISTYNAYLGEQGSPRYGLMRSILFFNTSNAEYFWVNSTANNTINYTLMVPFTGREILGGDILGPSLVKSNLFKFTTLCNNAECPYDNANVTLTLAFANGDTRIYKINYLH